MFVNGDHDANVKSVKGVSHMLICWRLNPEKFLNQLLSWKHVLVAECISFVVSLVRHHRAVPPLTLTSARRPYLASPVLAIGF
jgi:hypothetical protein